MSRSKKWNIDWNDLQFWYFEFSTCFFTKNPLVNIDVCVDFDLFKLWIIPTPRCAISGAPRGAPWRCAALTQIQRYWHAQTRTDIYDSVDQIPGTQTRLIPNTLRYSIQYTNCWIEYINTYIDTSIMSSGDPPSFLHTHPGNVTTPSPTLPWWSFGGSWRAAPVVAWLQSRAREIEKGLSLSTRVYTTVRQVKLTGVRTPSSVPCFDRGTVCVLILTSGTVW
jgi:hypothetical protein